jgi:heat shock transcription factor
LTNQSNFQLQLTIHSFLDKDNTDLIRWSDHGNSFIVLDEDEFAKTLIPELFKHNNYASFVRQLNMYGFHKTVGLSDNSMRASERKHKNPSEYENIYFRRGHPGLLWLIQKPKTVPAATKGKGKRAASEGNDEDAEEYMEDMANIDHRMHHKPQLAIGQGEASLSTEKFQSVQRELSTIRKQQQQILHMMTQLKREHEQLYDQATTFQTQHTQHEKSITAILTFLATIYQRGRLNGNDAASGIAGLFANSGVQHDANQGNVVDVGDYNFDGLNGESFGKPLKKQPLLLQGPPSDRAATMSPNTSSDTYTPRMTRRTSQALRQGSTPVATVEEVFDSNQPTPISPRQHARKPSQQADIMSMIQNSNARSTPSTPADFSNVLNDLEHNGGNTPLTQSQRQNMLQLMSDSAGQGGENTLVNATPPVMPKDYGRNLQRNQADLDSLARLQAEQDRSVQNLTELLQPLSPTGSIPGIHDGQYVPPGSLDIDNFLNQDYFNEFPSDHLQYDFSENGNGLYRPSDSIGLNDLPQDEDDELFGDTSMLPNDQVDYDGNPINGGRVESIASSEVTTPSTSSTADVNGDGPTTRSSLKGRRMSGELEKSPGKRRKREV